VLTAHGDGAVRADRFGQAGLEGREIRPEDEIPVADGPSGGVDLGRTDRGFGEADARVHWRPFSQMGGTGRGLFSQWLC
jgi:hypothetical protein